MSASNVSYEIAKLLKAVDNRLCADCQTPLTEITSVFASLSFGVWICEACAQAHYKVLPSDASSHLKKAIASWSKEEIAIMQKAKSNVAANAIYERYLPAGWTKITSTSSNQERKDWVQAKYFSFYFSIPQKTLCKQKKRRVDRDERLESLNTLPTRIVDYLLVLDPGKPKVKDPSKIKRIEDILFHVDVRDCYPLFNSHADTPVPELVGSMVFPHGLTLSKQELSPFSFTFVLTDINRTKLFGATLIVYELVDKERLEALVGPALYAQLAEPEQVYYAPKALTVLSHYGFYTLFTKFLAQLYKVSLSTSPVPLERYVVNFMQELPLPPQGTTEVIFTLPEVLLQISRPPKNHLPMVDFSFRPLFAHLSVDNILTLFTCLCLEMTICVCASNIALLTPVQEALLSFLFPFVWQGCYVPILPSHMLELLDAPVPLLVGMHDSFLLNTKPEHRASNVVFVHLDTDSIMYGHHDELLTSQPILQLPKGKVEKLREKLKKYGGCVHRKDLQIFAKAGYPFPNNEHLIPIRNYLFEQGVLSQTQQKVGLMSSTDWMHSQHKHGIRKATPISPAGSQIVKTTAKQSEAVPYRHPAASTLAVASSADNDIKAFNSVTALDSEHNCTGKEEGQFNALEIREAFLRFFVASFMDYQTFINHTGNGNGGAGGSSGGSGRERKVSMLGRKLGNLVSGSGRSAASVDGMSVQSESALMSVETESSMGRPNFFNKDAFVAHLQDEFLGQMVHSQMFSNFLSERLQGFEQVEIRFFDENILAKENRSILNVSKNSTPFLSDDSDYLRESFSVPTPSTVGLAADQTFTYSSFPRISTNMAGVVRKPKVLIKSLEVKRVEGEAGREVLIQHLAAQNEAEASSSADDDANAAEDSLNPDKFFATARKRYDDVLGAVRWIQRRFAVRRYVWNLRKQLNAIRLMQRYYRRYLRRRRLRLRVYAVQCKKLQAVWRMYRWRRRFLVTRRLVVCLQALARSRRQRSVYKRMLAAVYKLQACVLGRRTRAQLKDYLQQQVAARRRLLLSLWVAGRTPLLQRAMAFLSLRSPSFLHLALLDNELQEWYDTLGFGDGRSPTSISKQVLSSAVSEFIQAEEAKPRSLARRSRHPPSSFAALTRDEKAWVVERSELVRKLRIVYSGTRDVDDCIVKVETVLRETFGNAARHAQAAANEAAERKALYVTMKAHQSTSNRQYEELYHSIGFAETKKRKQKISMRLLFSDNEAQFEKEASFMVFSAGLQTGGSGADMMAKWYAEKSQTYLRKFTVEAFNACFASLRHQLVVNAAQKAGGFGTATSNRVGKKNGKAAPVNPATLKKNGVDRKEKGPRK